MCSPAWRAVIAIAILATAACGCSARSQPAPGQASRTAAPPASIGSSASGSAGSGQALHMSGLDAVRPCAGVPAFSCGTLSVRLDPFGSVPGRLSLQVAVSDVAAAPRGVLLLLTGGPGQPGLPFVSRLASRLECGTAWVNQHGSLHPMAPFGGVKRSGIGIEFNVDGLKEYTTVQVVNVAL